MKKSIFIAVTIVLIAVIIIAFLQLEKKNKQYIIGSIMPLSGDVATYGVAIKQGIELAIEQINYNGGINNKLISVIYEDSKAEPKEGVTVFEKLISVNNVDIIIGAVASSVTLAIAPIAEKSQTILFSAASSSPKISNAGDFIFRNYPSDDLEGKIVAEYAYDNGYVNAAILTINNDYGIGLNTVFEKEYIELGGKITLNDKYNEGETNFFPILTKIQENEPQCIFIVGYGKDLGLLVKQAINLGIKSQFFSTVNFYDERSITSGGTAVEGVIFSSPVFDSESENENILKFVKTFKSKFGKKPDVWSAHSYDATLIIADAISRTGNFNVNEIKNEIYLIKNFNGVSGLTTFDKNGDVMKEAKFLTVKKGKFIPLEINNAKTN
ncbi:MAG: penicillin-binding protein activator [Candidatus Cloacimonetes bacterium]|nr:penicillin-binding protein activator [Candidatus Cloacimonadota bacterium]